MSEIATSILNKNSNLYGTTETPIKNDGPACVDGKGKDAPDNITIKPEDAPILAVREK